MANLRTIDYKGFTSASTGTGPKGWMLWSGSEQIGGESYSEIGMELVGGSESYLRFNAADAGAEIDIKARKFFIGTQNSQFISGSSGNIEISSSLFHLDPTNSKLVIGAGTTINAELSADEIFVPAGKNAGNATAYISGSGEAKFAGNGSGNYKVVFNANGDATMSGFIIDTSEIKDPNGNLRLKSSGQITGSQVNFSGGEIGGFQLSAQQIKSYNRKD